MYPIDTQDKLFHDGNGTTELGTIVTAEWLNAVQQSLLMVLADGKQVPAKAKHNLLRDAIRRMISDRAPSASATVAGIVQLSDSLTDDSNSKALTAKQGKALKALMDDLGSPYQVNTTALDKSTDLDTLKGIEKYGIYVQSGSANALASSHYPKQKAGTLMVLPSAYQGVQLYIPFDERVIYVRHTQSSGQFSEWRQIGEVVNTLDSPSITAALSAAQGKLLKNLIDNQSSLKTVDYSLTQGSGHIPSGFYRNNGARLNNQALPSLDIHINHPGSRGLEYARGIGFSYGGNWDVFTTSYDSSGQYLGMKRILTEVGNQTICGELTIEGSLTGWARLYAAVKGGKWRWEVNPASATDPRFNFVFMPDGGTPLYASFPKLEKNETVAYRSWVETQLDSAVQYQKISTFEIIKFANGVMIQSNKIQLDNASVRNTVARQWANEFNWAVAFIEHPIVHASAPAQPAKALQRQSNGADTFIDYYATNTKCGWSISDGGRDWPNGELHFTAIGRWK